jgi:hypothetical protein
MQRMSLLTGIRCYDHFDSMGRECFGWACDRRGVFAGAGDRSRLTVRRVPFSDCSSLPWFRLGKCWLDIGGISRSSPKFLFAGFIYEISDDAR